MNVLVTGASGFVGSALTAALNGASHHVIRMVRSSPKPGSPDIRWNPESGELDAAAVEGAQLDGVVHLAGESIAGRWNAQKKMRIRASRVKGTTLLCETFARLKRPPKVLVSASAIGYYGDRGDEVLTESSAPGSDFLAGVCQEWEAATAPAQRAGIRVVLARLGVVLGPGGGALAKMLTPFKLGVGGVIGSGRQYMSWVALDDVVGATQHALLTESLSGPMNVVAPNPATNREFTKTLGKVLSRPTIFPMPAFAARLAFGEMADALFLSSARVKPETLQYAGYAFKYSELEGALRHVLEK